MAHKLPDDDLFWLLVTNLSLNNLTKELLQKHKHSLIKEKIVELTTYWNEALVSWNENVMPNLPKNYSQYAVIALLFLVCDKLVQLFKNLNIIIQH